MIEICTHELGGESSEDLLLAYGIDVKKTVTTNDKESAAALLQPKTYPHCNEPNKSTSKFCTNCQMVLTFDAFNETIKEAEEAKKEREEIKAQLKILQANTSNLFKLLMEQEEKKNDLKLYVSIRKDLKRQQKRRLWSDEKKCNNVPIMQEHIRVNMQSEILEI